MILLAIFSTTTSGSAIVGKSSSRSGIYGLSSFRSGICGSSSSRSGIFDMSGWFGFVYRGRLPGTGQPWCAQLGGELNKSGELFIKRNPQLKVNVVDESSLAVAVVLYNISKGTTQVVIRGDFNKVSYYLALALCQKGIQVAISKENDYQKLKSKLHSSDDHDRFVLSRAYSQKNWLPRRVMSAWRIAGILDGLEGWNIQAAEANKDNLSALMVTYPSTHGVYEEDWSDESRMDWCRFLQYQRFAEQQLPSWYLEICIKLGGIVLYDVRFLKGDMLKIEESALTSESLPVTWNLYGKLSLWSEWDPCRARVRGYRDCGRGLPSADGLNAMVWPRPKGLLYLLYIIKSPQSSMFAACGVVPRADPHPKSSEFNADVCNYLAANLTSLKKLPKPFLCFVGIRRYYELDVNCYPTYLTDDEEEMDLFVFINHADLTKVRIGEREVREGEVSLLELTRGRVVLLTGVNDQGDANIQDVGHNVVNKEGAADGQENPVNAGIVRIEDEVPATVAEKAKATRGASGSSLPPKKLRDDHDTFRAGASTGGKSVAVLQSLLEGSTLAVEVGVAAASTVPFLTSSVTLTPEREGGGFTDSLTGPNLRTQRPAERFVISLELSHHSSTNVAEVKVSSVVRSPVLDPPILTTPVATMVVVDTSSVPMPRAGYEPVHHTLFRDSTSISEANLDIAEMDSDTLHQTYVPKWNVTNDSALDDPDVCRSVIDHLAPPVLFS
ncbi:gypsy type transposase [Tanacetum coccineum]